MSVCLLPRIVAIFFSLISCEKNIPSPPSSSHNVPFLLEMNLSHDPCMSCLVSHKCKNSVSVTLLRCTSKLVQMNFHLMNVSPHECVIEVFNCDIYVLHSSRSNGNSFRHLLFFINLFSKKLCEMAPACLNCRLSGLLPDYGFHLFL